MFIKYPKILRIDHNEIKNLLEEKDLIITEKLDGTNLSIWKKNDSIQIAKRTSQISLDSKDMYFICCLFLKIIIL